MVIIGNILGVQLRSIVDLAFYKQAGQPWFRGIFCHVSTDPADTLAYVEAYFSDGYQYFDWLNDSNLNIQPTNIGVYNLKDTWMYGIHNDSFRTITIQATNGVMPHELRRTGPIYWYDESTGDSDVTRLAHTYSFLLDRVPYVVYYSVELRRTVFYVANGPESKLETLLSQITTPSAVEGVTVERSLKTSASFTQFDVGVVRVTYNNVQIPYRVTQSQIVDVHVNGSYQFYGRLRSASTIKSPVFIAGV